MAISLDENERLSAVTFPALTCAWPLMVRSGISTRFAGLTTGVWSKSLKLETLPTHALAMPGVASTLEPLEAFLAEFEPRIEISEEHLGAR